MHALKLAATLTKGYCPYWTYWSSKSLQQDNQVLTARQYKFFPGVGEFCTPPQIELPRKLKLQTSPREAECTFPTPCEPKT